MLRCFSQIQDEVAHFDEIGVALHDVNMARVEGMVLAGRLNRDAGVRTKLGEDWCVQVIDDRGLVLFRMDFIVAASGATAFGAVRR